MVHSLAEMGHIHCYTVRSKIERMLDIFNVYHVD